MCRTLGGPSLQHLTSGLTNLLKKIEEMAGSRYRALQGLGTKRPGLNFFTAPLKSISKIMQLFQQHTHVGIGILLAQLVVSSSVSALPSPNEERGMAPMGGLRNAGLGWEAHGFIFWIPAGPYTPYDPVRHMACGKIWMHRPARREKSPL